jgi:hypothetical protein
MIETLAEARDNGWRITARWAGVALGHELRNGHPNTDCRQGDQHYQHGS